MNQPTSLPASESAVHASCALAFPSFDGNGRFKSLGNVLVNPYVGVLFIDFAKLRRLRVNGTASLDEHDPLLSELPGAQLVVRVQAHATLPNRPRCIHDRQIGELSEYTPRDGHEPPEPKWKSRPDFCDVLPPNQPSESAVGARRRAQVQLRWAFISNAQVVLEGLLGPTCMTACLVFRTLIV